MSHLAPLFYFPILYMCGSRYDSPKGGRPASDQSSASHFQHSSRQRRSQSDLESSCYGKLHPLRQRWTSFNSLMKPIKKVFPSRESSQPIVNLNETLSIVDSFECPSVPSLVQPPPRRKCISSNKALPPLPSLSPLGVISHELPQTRRYESRRRAISGFPTSPIPGDLVWSNRVERPGDIQIQSCADRPRVNRVPSSLTRPESPGQPTLANASHSATHRSIAKRSEVDTISLDHSSAAPSPARIKYAFLARVSRAHITEIS